MNKRMSSGFTMMEIMVVLVIIGILISFIGPRIVRYMGKSTETAVKLKLVNIKDALTMYKMELGAFPTEREGLKALLQNPRPNDDRYKQLQNQGKWPWVDGGEEAISHAGIDFVYHCPPNIKNKTKGYRYYEVIFPGPTGEDNDPEYQDAGA